MLRQLVILLAVLTIAAPLRGIPQPSARHDPPEEHPDPKPPAEHKPGSDGKKRQERSLNGTYRLELDGDYKGTGTATVSENTLSIAVKVTLLDGSTADLTANNVVIDGPYFSGRGKVKDQVLTINGKLDAAKASRLTGSYRSASGQSGRFVGTLPSDSGDDKWAN